MFVDGDHQRLVEEERLDLCRITTIEDLFRLNLFDI